jgi:hypothetical protein
MIPRVRIPRPTPVDYATLQSAYADAADGESLKLLADTFSEQLLLDRAISIILDGGRSSDFATVSGFSTLQGSLTIQSGSVTVSYVIID